MEGGAQEPSRGASKQHGVAPRSHFHAGADPSPLCSPSQGLASPGGWQRRGGGRVADEVIDPAEK